MFYTQFIKLCNEQKKEPSLVAEAIGLNRSSATAWKKGSKPKATTVAALADYFGVDVSVFSDDKRDTIVCTATFACGASESGFCIC